MTKLLAFLAAVPGSVKGSINRAELIRALNASGIGAALVHVALAMALALEADAPNIFIGPLPVTMGTWLLGLTVELLRRLDHEAPATPEG